MMTSEKLTLVQKGGGGGDFFRGKSNEELPFQTWYRTLDHFIISTFDLTRLPWDHCIVVSCVLLLNSLYSPRGKISDSSNRHSLLVTSTSYSRVENISDWKNISPRSSDTIVLYCSKQLHTIMTVGGCYIINCCLQLRDWLPLQQTLLSQPDTTQLTSNKSFVQNIFKISTKDFNGF